MAEEYDDDLVTTVHRRFKDARDYTVSWRDQARQCFDFDAGRQWSQDDLSLMERENRIAVTINRLSRVVNSVVGTQIQNRNETRYIPRELGDVQVSELYTAAGDWVRDNCNAEDEESDSFADMLISGMGWIETRLETEREADGEILMERVDPLHMWWDPTARRKNISDRRWQMMVKRISWDDFEARWPDADASSAAGPWDDDVDDDQGYVRQHVYPQDAYNRNQNQQSGADDARISVAHYQWFELEDAYRIGSQAVMFSVSQFNKMKSSLDDMGIQYLKQKKRVYHECWVAGSVLLEERDIPVNDFTYVPMCGRRDRNKNVWRGIVVDMLDPQRWANKLYSVSIDILNKNSKGGVIAERDAFDDPRTVEEMWARPDAIHWANPGAISSNKIMPKPVSQIPGQLDQLLAYATNSIHEVVGINLETMGQANREQAGILEYQRRKQGITMMAPFFDAIRQYRKEQGKALLAFIDKFISDGRLIRIMGEGKEQYVPLRQREGTHTYDIVVDESAQSPNQKDATYAVLGNMVPALISAGVPVPPEILDYAPIPSQLAVKWKEMISKQGQVPEEVQLAMAEKDQGIQKLMEENVKLKDKRAEMMMDAQVKQVELQQKEVASRSEQERKRAEMEADFLMEREKFMREVEMSRQKAEVDVALQREKLENDLAIAFAKLEVEREAKVAADVQGAKNLVDEAIDSSLERVLRKPRRKVVFERDADGFIQDAIVEDIMDDVAGEA